MSNGHIYSKYHLKRLKSPPRPRKLSYPPRNIQLPNILSEKELKAAFDCEVKLVKLKDNVQTVFQIDRPPIKNPVATPTPTLSHGKCQAKLCFFCYENYSIKPLTEKL